MMWLLSAAGGPPRTGPTACGIRSWGQWRVQSLGGSWGELLPGAGTACAAGTGTAQHIPSSAVCKLSCGKVATKYLIFFLIFFFSFPLPGWCSPEEEVYGRRQLEGFVPLLSAEEMPAASSDRCTGRRTES